MAKKRFEPKPRTPAAIPPAEPEAEAVVVEAPAAALAVTVEPGPGPEAGPRRVRITLDLPVGPVTGFVSKTPQIEFSAGRQARAAQALTNGLVEAGILPPRSVFPVARAMSYLFQLLADAIDEQAPGVLHPGAPRTG